MTVLDELRDSLQSRLTEVKEEIELIEEVLAPLERRRNSRKRRGSGKRGGRPKGSTSGSGKPKRQRRAKRIPLAEREKALVAFAKANPKASNKEIAKALKIGEGYAGNLVTKSEKVKRENGKLVVGG
jgi:DNA-binding CsgD family transcriptional regulator